MAHDLIQKMLNGNIVEAVSGHEKGRYKFTAKKYYPMFPPGILEVKIRNKIFAGYVHSPPKLAHLPRNAKNTSLLSINFPCLQIIVVLINAKSKHKGDLYMKATGIVRRIDDLGRVVIPKEIRRTMRIREGDPLEIYTDSNGEVIFKKYSPIGELEPYTKQYAEVLNRTTNLPVIICDRDHVIAVAGLPRKDALDRRITSMLEDYMERRAGYVLDSSAEPLSCADGIDRPVSVMSPIIGAGDVMGAVVLLVDDKGGEPSQTDVKLAQVAASFLGKQMEE